MKKIAGEFAKKVVATTAVNSISSKVKEEVERKVHSYKKRFALLALELGFFVLGFNFFMLGIIELVSKRFPMEYVLLVFGLFLILLGVFFSKGLRKHRKN